MIACSSIRTRRKNSNSYSNSSRMSLRK